MLLKIIHFDMFPSNLATLNHFSLVLCCHRTLIIQAKPQSIIKVKWRPKHSVKIYILKTIFCVAFGSEGEDLKKTLMFEFGHSPKVLSLTLLVFKYLVNKIMHIWLYINLIPNMQFWNPLEFNYLWKSVKDSAF